MERYAIIVAGGKGLRMGGEIPKQFIPVAGRPVLMRTIDAFCQALPGVHVILVLPVHQQEYWQELCVKYGFDTPLQIANGGETRFHSVKNGLDLVPAGEDGVVGVHDGVRPFVSAETIRTCYDAAWESGAVVPVIPVVETVRHLRDGNDSETVNRDCYRLVQTPQTFRIDVLKRAYSQDYVPEFTDDASVVERMGHPVVLVEGNKENIKLTTPSDLKYAEFLAKI